MKKRIVFFTTLFISAGAEPAISQEKKTITSWGYTAVMDYYSSPVKKIIRYNDYSSRNDTLFLRNQGFTLFKYYVRISRVLFPIDSNQAVSLNINPGLGFSISFSDEDDYAGLGSFTLPLMLAYERGAGSTYSSTSDYGISLQAGAQLVRLPIGYIDSQNSPGYRDYVSTWVHPAVSIGIRRWKARSRLFGDENKEEILMEYNLFVGMGDKRTLHRFINGQWVDQYKRSLNICVSFMRFFNY